MSLKYEPASEPLHISVKSLTCAPVSVFQIRMSLSSDPLTMRFPSDENATEFTDAEWPFSVCTWSDTNVYEP